MIPLKVKLKGFLSYREEQTLDFRDATLWVLFGRNGHGKSAVFDAITFALFKEHRGGKQDAIELINKDSTELLVEFEFQMDQDIYRVKRTQSRKGRASRQAIHVCGPSRPYFNREGEQSIPGTEGDSQFEEWVKNTIGLDYEAYTASFLLLQGKADVILQAKAPVKLEMLKQLVKLDNFDRLYQLTKKHSNEFSVNVRVLMGQIGKLPEYTEEQVAFAEEAVKVAQESEAQAQNLLVKLAGLKEKARNWQKLLAEEITQNAQVAEAENLLSEEDEIKINAERYHSLGAALPILRRLQEEQNRLDESNRLGENYHQEEQKLAANVAQLTTALENAEKQVIELTKAFNAAKNQQKEALQIKLELSQAVFAIGEWGKNEKNLEALEKQLVGFPLNLSEQLYAQTQLVGEADKARVVLDPLRRYTDARQEWQKADEQENQHQQDLRNIDAHIVELQKSLAESEKLKTEAGQAVATAKVISTTSETLQKELENRLKRFKQIEGKPTCDYCGQELTPEHIETERAQLEGIVAEAKQTTLEARKCCTALEKEEQATIASFTAHGEKLRQSGLDRQQIQNHLDTSQRDKMRTEKAGREVISQLPEQYRANFNLEAGIVACFGLPYPQIEVLTRLKQQNDSYPRAKKEFEELQKRANERQLLVSKLEEVQQKIVTYQEQYPSSRRQEIIEANQEAENLEALANLETQKVQPQFVTATKEQNKLQKDLDKVKESRQNAANAAQNELTKQAEIRRALQQQRDSLEADWQSQVATLTLEQVKAWEVEARKLVGAPARLEKLAEAHYGFVSLKRQLDMVRAQLEAIPPEEKLTAQQVEQQETTAQKALEKARGQREASEEQLRIIQNVNQQRANLENQRQEANHQALLHKTLADLLGPNHLQRHLLDQAEKGIVSNANQILDNLSNGTIQLKLVGSSLDLEALIRDGDNVKSIGVAYLSGSQKFRVAVSLALGMGRYASRSGRLGESVIIDEGFGSLDKEGRQEMIDVLHELKDMLARIILVSHQEEFFESFEQGYEIRLVDGTSIAKRR